jgi:2-phospho-L-lactate guanylyltransferase
LLKAADDGALATWAIVALKTPGGAKSRLRAYCSDGERLRLYFLMARTVIEALLAVPAIGKVLAVTASDDVERFVRDLGGCSIRQPEDHGTQAAFAYALRCLACGDSPRPDRLLMISGDIPLITPLAVTELLDRCVSRRGVAIVPDRRRQGTNALVCSPPGAVDPCFGEDSLRRHWCAARARGIDVRVIESPALSLDIDDHEDLILLSQSLASSRAGSDLGTGSDVDTGLTAWLSRHFACAAFRGGFIENADCA